MNPTLERSARALVPLALATVMLVFHTGAACSRPARTDERATEPTTEGDESNANARRQDDDASRPPGAWAPRHSLARIERLPREGTVETRASLSGADRIVLVVPITDDGNVLFEAFGIPARDPDALVIGVRAAHEPARWTACATLTLRAGDRTLALTDTRPDAVPSPLGTIETVQARTTLADLRALDAPDTLTLDVCDDHLEVRGTAAHLRELAARFERAAAAAPAQTDADADAPAEAPTPSADRAPDSQ